MIDQGQAQGADLVVDGRDFSLQGYENGFFLGSTLFDQVKPHMEIYRQEIFGPVLSVMEPQTFDSATQLINEHQYGNGTAIFTRDGDAARTFADEIEVGMVGINVPIPVPVGYHSFGDGNVPPLVPMAYTAPRPCIFIRASKPQRRAGPKGSPKARFMPFHPKARPSRVF